MAVETVNFTTGPSTLPDVGELSYNSCIFSPLFETNVSGMAAKDKANRTVKQVDYLITADGYVTLPSGATSIGPTMATLAELLTQQAGALTYRGRALDIIINTAGGGGRRDVAWGPVPELLEFQPLGGGRSAKVRWQVKVSIFEPFSQALANFKGPAPFRPLQFNYETSVTYGEDGFSNLSIRGTLEIPMTRTSQKERTLPFTADTFRSVVETRVMSGIDLSRFHVTRRDFAVSRDKRSIEWTVEAAERPYMDMPPNCTIARGTYSVRPAKVGMGLALWLCTLKATYNVRHDKPRRVAWLAFLALLHLRMAQSRHGKIPGEDKKNPALPNSPPVVGPPFISFNLISNFIDLIKMSSSTPVSNNRAWLIDFSFDEGLYLDSKTVTFSATWRLATTFSHILIASGLWKKLPEKDAAKNNLWAVSMRDVSGSESWLPNKLDPTLDVIVDFGGG